MAHKWPHLLRVWDQERWTTISFEKNIENFSNISNKKIVITYLLYQKYRFISSWLSNCLLRHVLTPVEFMQYSLQVMLTNKTVDAQKLKITRRIRVLDQCNDTKETNVLKILVIVAKSL